MKPDNEERFDQEFSIKGMNRDAQSLVITILRFDSNPETIHPPPATDWEAVLAYCDRYQLTLAFGRSMVHGPEWVRARLRRNAAANRIRHEGILQTYAAVQSSTRGMEHLLLKGFTLAPEFCPDPAGRVQYDLDLYCRREELLKTRDALLALGYESLGGPERFPTDHLPPLIRKTGWEWRGDFFDCDLPLSIELHFRFWDEATERFPAGNLDGFWERRRTRHCDGVEYNSLGEADALGYACLHALRHLLRGDPRPNHFLEIGYFLQRQTDSGFWEEWLRLHDPALRRIEAICFRFANEWFGCRIPELARREVEALPQAVDSWFARWAHSPLHAPFRPNKDELWLHLSLLESFADKAAVVRRRLLPMRLPGPVDAVHIPDHQLTTALRLRRQWRYLKFTGKRAWHHARALVPALCHGVAWFFARHGFSAGFWRFFRAFVIFNSSLMIFHLLYNLHLLSQGYLEDFVGKVSSAMTLGSLAGSLVAGLVLMRIGLRTGLMLTFVSQGAASALRVYASTPAPLLGFAFMAGLSQSFYAVCLVPAIAALTTDRNRPFAYSLTMGTGISLGIGAGMVGGHLPTLLHSTEAVLWMACAVAPLAVAPLLGLHFGKPGRLGFRALWPNAFLRRFLAAISIWGLATGAFNPFFNVFLSRAMHFPVETIGLLFTLSQLAQVVAIAISPVVFRGMGLMPGIAAMQAATGVALAGLGIATPALAMFLYPMYMAFQYMSEPGIFSMLMKEASAEERTGASAWNFIVVYSTHALAAWLAGLAITQYGYPTVLIVAGLLCLLAARAMIWATPSR